MVDLKNTKGLIPSCPANTVVIHTSTHGRHRMAAFHTHFPLVQMKTHSVRDTLKHKEYYMLFDRDFIHSYLQLTHYVLSAYICVCVCPPSMSMCHQALSSIHHHIAF